MFDKEKSLHYLALHEMVAELGPVSLLLYLRFYMFILYCKVFKSVSHNSFI